MAKTLRVDPGSKNGRSAPGKGSFAKGKGTFAVGPVAIAKPPSGKRPGNKPKGSKVSMSHAAFHALGAPKSGKY